MIREGKRSCAFRDGRAQTRNGWKEDGKTKTKNEDDGFRTSNLEKSIFDPSTMFLSVLFGFLLGVACVVAVEGIGLYFILRRLIGRKKESRVKSEDGANVRDLSVDQRPLVYPYEKQGLIWILDEKQMSSVQHVSQLKTKKDQKKKKGPVEVSPVKRKAKIKEHELMFTDEDDNSRTTIHLLNCEVKAVSSSNSPSRKWAKKYPIRVESKNKIIYNGSRVCYIYLETSWEKEAWCKALHLASCSLEKTNWYNQLNVNFLSYLASLNCEYYLFPKPSELPGETTNKNRKAEENPSKVRRFFKKVARKATTFGSEPKSTTLYFPSKGEIRAGDKKLQDVFAPVSASSDSAGKENFSSEEGTLYLNLLFSRMFFDVKRSMEINRSIKERIQRAFLTMRTPSHIGAITCTGLDLGNHPPYVHNIKALPINMNEGWAVDLDIEYSGCFLLEVETRLDIQKGIASASAEVNSAGDVTPDLSTDSDEVDRLDEEMEQDALKQQKGGTRPSAHMSRWRMILNDVSDHVSLVPISLEIKVASLRGTLRLQVKPPPSDQLWIGFTSMPEIDLNLNSCIGDHRIASTYVALLISNRLKTAIRDTMVLPNCESIYIPWMEAEKDDWLPQSVAPFIWIRRGSGEVPQKDDPESQSLQVKAKSDSVKKIKNNHVSVVEHSKDEIRNVAFVPSSKTGRILNVLPETGLITASSPDMSSNIRDLRAAQKANNEMQETANWCDVESSEMPQISTVSAFQQNPKPAEEEITATEERVKEFEKKKSGEFVEKLYHVEDKERYIMENVATDVGLKASVSANGNTSNYTIEDLKVPLLTDSESLENNNISRTASSENSQLSTCASIYNQSPKSLDEERTKRIGKRERVWDFGRKMSEKFDEKRRQFEDKGRKIVMKMREGSVNGKSSFRGDSSSRHEIQ